jgi:NAD(P)-dependent dehydrogenase (short-subunit alcohol dehydrogenase family)
MSADPNSGWHAKRRHPVENVASDFCLGPLIGQSPGVKPPADDIVFIASNEARFITGHILDVDGGHTAS